uniref:Uncharacterized protein n=1 Tax=Glossina austeni TaxID=7395 RepID=A0A1A9V2N5_GLOAU
MVLLRTIGYTFNSFTWNSVFCNKDTIGPRALPLLTKGGISNSYNIRVYKVEIIEPIWFGTSWLPNLQHIKRWSFKYPHRSGFAIGHSRNITDKCNALLASNLIDMVSPTSPGSSICPDIESSHCTKFFESKTSNCTKIDFGNLPVVFNATLSLLCICEIFYLLVSIFEKSLIYFSPLTKHICSMQISIFEWKWKEATGSILMNKITWLLLAIGSHCPVPITEKESNVNSHYNEYNIAVQKQNLTIISHEGSVIQLLEE